jgi:predicted AlkP superfamily phosphohydrolase/phosphomutase/tetratricopeptide (TPR) repeat protein
MASRKVLLVGWDAADWKVIHPLMDAGKMPNVRRLVENGATGQIATLHPPLSPMLWTSIATGKRPFKHGILGFSEPTPDGRGVQPVTNLSRKSKALWNILNQNHLRSVVIGWWPSHPAEPIDGVMVSDHFHRAGGPLDKGWPPPANAVHPPELAATLADLRVHPDLLTPQMVEPFIPLAKDIDQDNDKRLGLFLRTLAECMSIHAAAIWLLDHQPWDFFAVYYDAIDHFCHGFMKYHPPRQSWIGERDFELYQNVVSMAYQFHDRMLGTLLEKAGKDTTVVLMSDHGFHPDHLRPASIPDIPAGPAIEHRDFGILAISGPDIKRNALLYGASVLDVVPTLLTLFGLPVGEDMDGKVLSQVFAETPRFIDNVAFLPSWEEVPGADGRHPPHMRLDPLAAHGALEQMIALGYIERPDDDREVAVEKTIRELSYNLGEAYQDGDRHMAAHQIFSALCAVDPDEQRFAVRLFVSCQALGMHQEMRRIVDDLDGRRRALFDEAKTKIEAWGQVVIERAAANRDREDHLRSDLAQTETGNRGGADAEPESMPGPSLNPPLNHRYLTDDERRELARWRNLERYQPPVIDYLKAQVLTAEKRYGEALATLERVTEAHLVRPGLFLQTADLYLRLHRWRDAQRVYEKALAIDPDNPHAHIGVCRMALRHRKFSVAAHSALDALQRIHHYPLAHFLLGLALIGMHEFGRAADAFRAAISFNPNFPEAHVRLASVLEKHLGDPDSAREHRRLARRMRGRATTSSTRHTVVPFDSVFPFDSTPRPLGAEKKAAAEVKSVAAVSTPSHTSFATTSAEIPAEMPPLAESLIIVTGLPRSGTSMLMQMLAAGGMRVLSDGLLKADEDNPRGYLEFEPVKNMLKDSSWLFAGKGKAIKIVAPLLAALPPGLPCRVILSERDLEEVLDSQERMLARRNHPLAATPERRRMLKEEYARTLGRVEAMLARRPCTQLLVIRHSHAISDPLAAAEKVNRFLGGGLDVANMAAAIDPALHRNRTGMSR